MFDIAICTQALKNGGADLRKGMAASLAEPSVKIVVEALAKPGVLRLEGVLGIVCGAYAAAATPAAGETRPVASPAATRLMLLCIPCRA